jgi:hypothetical protein
MPQGTQLPFRERVNIQMPVQRSLGSQTTAMGISVVDSRLVKIIP